MIPHTMAADADTEHGLTGRAEIHPVSLQARGYPLDVGNLRIAKPHHVRRARLLRFRGSPVLRIGAGEPEHKNSGSEHSGIARGLHAIFPDELYERYAAIPMSHLRPPICTT
jgi:hypothetical protein